SDVTILRQINRLNDDGSYTFGYEAADGSFKIETRDVEGNVKGMFGFVDENGELKRISYSARNGTGFQASGTIATPVENARLNPSYTTVKPPAHHPFLKRPILILK
ncbi:larval cuticle protein 1-like, partial [Diaphorina citri]|uniref:Larval cuticle protein 1-like n=1 Tax=Diaphorina citri TaxID=121845 RepID=A0A1S3DSS8_DIACI